MNLLITIIYRGWAPILITVLAVIGRLYEWPIELLATILGLILIFGIVTAVIGTREKELERSSQRLKELAGYFARRFMGDSSLSIFAIINSLFKTDDPKLWDWARACDMSQRVLNTWCSSFISRVETDTRTGRFSIYLRSYLNELWLMTSLYHEYIEQFYEIAEKMAIPQETIDQYRKFTMEYNAFVEQFQDLISEIKKFTRTEIEPPSIKPAYELAGIPIKQAQPKEKK